MDAVELSLFSSRVAAVCDEMGAVLRRAAVSPTIFDAQGQLCSSAAQIPVHLGSMACAMAELVRARTWSAGDMLLVNDPFQGGTHLPDVTLIAPVLCQQHCVGSSPTARSTAISAQTVRVPCLSAAIPTTSAC